MGSRSFLELRSATDASEVFALAMQALVFAGFGGLLSGSYVLHLAALAIQTP
jgi:hypothetical protein